MLLAPGERCRRAPPRADAPRVALLYVLIAVLAFWASFGPDAGLYRLFYETLPIFSFLCAHPDEWASWPRSP